MLMIPEYDKECDCEFCLSERIARSNVIMERIYCDCYCLWKSGIETDDYDPDATSAECTYRMIGTFCTYSESDRIQMEDEGVYCPFWDITGAWIDIRELDYLEEHD